MLFFQIFRSCLKRKVTETSSVPLTDKSTIVRLTNSQRDEKIPEQNSKSAVNHVIIPPGTLSNQTRPKSADHSVASLRKSQNSQNVISKEGFDKTIPCDSNTSGKQVRSKVRSADNKKHIRRQQTIKNSEDLPEQGTSFSTVFSNPAYER